MPNYSWPPMASRKVMGQRLSRLDGIEKAAGRAKYNSDLNKPGMLHAVLLTCPHAHAKLKSIDTSAAEQHAGVAAVRVITQVGTEIQWAGWEVAVVAADSELAAHDAVGKIKVEYDVMPHVVIENDLKKVQTRAKPAGEQLEGDPDQALKDADVTLDGTYGIPTLTHCCLETHGQVIGWGADGKVEFNPSTQSVTSIRGDLARLLSIPATDIHVHQDHIGGGFGSKFQPDRWGIEAAQLSKTAGGKPVKLFLERSTELMIAGCRPSGFLNVKLGAKKDGTITAWQSESWASGGIGGGGSPPIPYVFTKIPNRRQNHTAVSLNTAPIRAWRAPNHQQASYLTCAPLEDLAAKLKMDPLQLFLKNANLTPREDTYVRQLNKAAELSDWKKLWHPRGDAGKGPIKRGLGIGVNTWGGAGHDSTARTTIHPDGTVEVELGSQDLGTGTRTIIAQVAAETLGLRVPDIRVKIGDTNYPPSGTSGGSTTVGGVTSSTRKATVNALDKLIAEVAGALGAPAEELIAVDGKIQVKGNAAKSLTWKAACQKLGVKTISETGQNVPREAPKEGLNTGGVGGVQIADVSVDVETGVVKMNKLVAVQDIGLVVNPKTAESQVFGACIMSICGALMEERIMDAATGRMLNADMEFYKLAGIKDIGEIVVHFEIDELNDKRGVIGLGEPPAIGGIAAISNAVANAIGTRVPTVPMTPMHVLDALSGRNS
ncbi:xanthine dehydrogenase family protein molybdopterin-binding subunit [uncultured Paludibaculum sp.]|uniref:xanthine dehydrogenase family protein molybdopterin-binding subunit n=1 Tax=uncultured Paludibaculum sp. TaxID=1765020 RepID=UPI002AAC18E9|nr:xanthine dehydrogenase family protein molybdopterin-binding subunit [uncultured Paludibaculum sp.]